MVVGHWGFGNFTGGTTGAGGVRRKEAILPPSLFADTCPLPLHLAAQAGRRRWQARSGSARIRGCLPHGPQPDPVRLGPAPTKRSPLGWLLGF